MYQYFVKFVPKNTPPEKANDIMCVKFEDKDLSESTARTKGYKNSEVDNYSLRNHWDIFEIDVNYSDAPWDSLEELVSRLMKYDIANNWKYVENKLYLIIENGKEKEYINYISSYYSPLGPRISSEGVVVVDVTPEL
jgi:16S rRNA G966 N2-methylase RsmD